MARDARQMGQTATPSGKIEPAAVAFRPEEAVGAVFFLVLVALSVAHDAPLFEPIRRSRLTYFTAIFLTLFLVGLAVWHLWIRLHRHGVNAVAGGTDRFRTMAVLRDWMPAILCLGIYESLKHLHLNEVVLWLGITPKDHWMIAVDEHLFGGHASVGLQAVISPAMTWYMKQVYYVGYYVYPVIVGLFLYIARPRFAFRELVIAFLSAAFIGYLFYILIPVAGPRFSEVAHLYTVPLTAHGTIEVMQMDTLRYQYDCFPSLHTAIPLTVLLIAFRHSKILGGLLAPFVLSTVLSTLYLRMHYVADVMAGVALAPVCVAIGVHGDAWWAKLNKALSNARAARSTGIRKTTVIHASVATVAVIWLFFLVR